MKLVSTILSSVLGLQDTDPIAERVRLCQDMESAAGYIDAANPGLVKHRSFMDHFRGKLAGVHRRFFDELQGRPNIRAAFNAANTTYAAYVTDLGVDHTGQNAGHDAPAPNYAPWWAAFRPAFTGVQSVYPWHILHGLTFRNPARIAPKRGVASPGTGTARAPPTRPPPSPPQATRIPTALHLPPHPPASLPTRLRNSKPNSMLSPRC